MYGDHPEIRPGSTEPVPPVRARPNAEELPAVPHGDLPLVAPVRSGFVEAPVPRIEPAPAEWTITEEMTEPVTPAAETAEWVTELEVEEEVTLVPDSTDWAGTPAEPEPLTLVPDRPDWTTGEESSAPASEVTWYGDEEATPWSEAVVQGDEEEEEIILEVSPAPVPEEAGVDIEISLEAEDEGEIVLDASIEAVEEEIVLEPVSYVEDESLEAAAPPLSPWDLGAASSAVEGAEERSARARAEWEAFGQALSQSLAASGGREIELTDEIAARLEATGAWEHAPEVPLFPGTPRPSEAPIARPQVPSGLADLASRLEAFAEKLRAEGTEALSHAQSGGDRVDAMLAAIAAGFLAGRGE